MINKELNETLVDLIPIYPKNILLLREKLYYYTNIGITQEDMLDTLEDLRNSLSEDYEDIILELMDFVTGFCNSNLKLY